MTRFSEKMFISTRCIHGFMSNLIKKSWTDSAGEVGGEKGEECKEIESFGQKNK